MNEVLKHPTLDSLKDGACLDLFNSAMPEVLRNIMDPGTKATQARKITLDISFMPNSDRTRVDISIKASTKLVSAQGAETIMYVARTLKGDLQAAEHNPAQLVIEPEMSPRPLEGAPQK